MLTLVQRNPYQAEEILDNQIKASIQQFPNDHATISISTDLSLSEGRIAQIEHTVPQSWRAFPGSIGITHNTEDMFLIWGAGIQGTPIKDEKTGIPRMIAVRINH